MIKHDARAHKFAQCWHRAMRSSMSTTQTWVTICTIDGKGPYRGESNRAALWAGMLPLLAVLLSITIHPTLVLLWPGVTALEFLHLARRNGTFSAVLSISCEYAELTGIARFLLQTLTGKTCRAPIYR